MNLEHSKLSELSEVAVLGAGSWGTALALLLAENGGVVRLWDRTPGQIAALLATRENKRYLPGHRLPENLHPTVSLSEALIGAIFVVVAVPSAAVDDVLERASLAPGADIILASKGIDPQTLELPADVALRSTIYAKKTLMAGFTTVRDLGAGDNLNNSLRDAIAKGWVVGPRIYSAGKGLATTGGHGDPTNGLNDELKGDPGPKEGVINGADDARKAVRQRYKDGCDVIKITGTGGVLSLAKNGMNPQLTEEEFKAIVETAHDYGMKVAVHAHGDEGMRRAILAGVDSIEHGTYMSDDTIKLMIARGTYYVPTISAGRFVADKAKIDGYFPAVVRPKAAAIGPIIQATFQRAYTAGVKIAFGTDMGVGPHGDNAKEFIYMVEAGMPPMKAIQSATLSAATLLGDEKNLGSLEKGKLADIVAVPGDPLADIKLMTQVSFVMKAGTVYKQ